LVDTIQLGGFYQGVSDGGYFSTNPLERLNKEIKRRTNVVGIFPNVSAIRRLVCALMLEKRRTGDHAPLHDSGNSRRHLQSWYYGSSRNSRPVNRLNTQPKNKLHHVRGHYQIETQGTIR
jgi:hypothetical protein